MLYCVYKVFVHNYPSGTPGLSKEDIELTKWLVKAGETMGIGVLDCIIVCDRSYLSRIKINEISLGEELRIFGLRLKMSGVNHGGS